LTIELIDNWHLIIAVCQLAEIDFGRVSFENFSANSNDINVEGFDPEAGSGQHA